MLVSSIFSFSHNDFKSLLSPGPQNKGLLFKQEMAIFHTGPNSKHLETIMTNTAKMFSFCNYDKTENIVEEGENAGNYRSFFSPHNVSKDLKRLKVSSSNKKETYSNDWLQLLDYQRKSLYS